MAFEIFYSPDALDHLASLSKAEQVAIVNQIELQLTHEPMHPTLKRKILRPNPIAPWSLRLGNVRVFYGILEEPMQVVNVVAIGTKIHNKLWIGGEQVEL
jgi:mRNA-degrading endonuclease RelE of RelBE toxin-antitoxin system